MPAGRGYGGISERSIAVFLAQLDLLQGGKLAAGLKQNNIFNTPCLYKFIPLSHGCWVVRLVAFGLQDDPGCH